MGIIAIFSTANAQDTSVVSFTSYSKFDFVPGEQVIYFENFLQAAIGDFPAKWNTDKSAEVVTIGNLPGKWLKTVHEAKYKPEIKSTGFPDNFTIEFDCVIKTAKSDDIGNSYQQIGLDIYSSANEQSLTNEGAGSGGRFTMNEAGGFNAVNWWENGDPGLNSSTDKDLFSKKDGKISHVSVWIQKQRGRLYIDETKVFDLPYFLPSGAKYNAISFSSSLDIDDEQNFISNIRIAVGAPDMRNKLITEGKLVTRGILFDVNSAKIKPESFGTLKEIAQVLKDNPTVKVKIIGHTDSDGAAAANFDLSKKRAASVKNSLINDFGIDASRMETDGKGASEPASPNTTPEGKANNRRVEFIKI